MKQRQLDGTCRECGAPLPPIDVTRCEPCLAALLGPLTDQQAVEEKARLDQEITRNTALVDALEALWEWREAYPESAD